MPLLRFYQACGFIILKLTSVHHGSEPWFELSQDMKKKSTQYQVDAFCANGPFSGNPAAVVLIEGRDDIDEVWMQNMATENNLAETAFLKRTGDKDTDFELQWFTPTAEGKKAGS